MLSKVPSLREKEEEFAPKWLVDKVKILVMDDRKRVFQSRTQELILDH